MMMLLDIFSCFYTFLKEIFMEVTTECFVFLVAIQPYKVLYQLIRLQKPEIFYLYCISIKNAKFRKKYKKKTSFKTAFTETENKDFHTQFDKKKKRSSVYISFRKVKCLSVKSITFPPHIRKIVSSLGCLSQASSSRFLGGNIPVTVNLLCL